MNNFKNGVNYYTIGKLNVDVGFPENDIKCEWCPYKTKVNGSWYCIPQLKPLYTLDSCPKDCPLEFEKEEEQRR